MGKLGLEPDFLLYHVASHSALGIRGLHGVCVCRVCVQGVYAGCVAGMCVQGYVCRSVCIGCVRRGVLQACVCRVCVQGVYTGCVRRGVSQACVCRGVCAGVCVQGSTYRGACAGACAHRHTAQLHTLSQTPRLRQGCSVCRLPLAPGALGPPAPFSKTTSTAASVTAPRG